MSTNVRGIAATLVVLGTIAAAASAVRAQHPQDTYIKYTHGQPIVPVFEGWDRNADGSFNMVFGYLNRNYVQQMSVPVGPENGFSPDSPDRGQPTYFYPRLNRYLFKVRVPADWPKTKELVWTLTVNGKTETARATLQDVWEIDRLVEVSNLGVAGGTSVSQKLLKENTPPMVKVAPVAAVTVGTPITFDADITDDGLPGETTIKPPRVVEPTLQGAPPSPTNVPMPMAPRAPSGLSMMWIVYRGPADVSFNPATFTKLGDLKGGKSSVKATFKQPGEYTLRAIASDGMLRSPLEVNVTVGAGAAPTPR